MFDVGLPELIVLGLVAMIFVGPERLPKVARWMGRVIVRGRRLLAELQRELAEDESMQEVREVGKQLRGEIDDMAHKLERAKGTIRSEADAIKTGLEDAGTSSGAPSDSSADSSAPDPDAELDVLINAVRKDPPSKGELTEQ